MSTLKEIQERAAAATPGPWQWFGNTEGRQVYLATVKYGRRFVMQFRRWGMQAAQPMFRSHPGAAGRMMLASEVPVFEVCRDATTVEDPRVYRADVVGFRNADAEFIARSRQDVDDLLAMITNARTLTEEWIENQLANHEPCGVGCSCCRALDIMQTLGGAE